MVYTPNHPPLQLTFWFPPGFRRVPPGSAVFRRVPPGSAGFRRVPLGSAAPPGAARFRWVPGFRQFSSTGLCRVSANKVPAPDSSFNLLLGLCKVLARRLPRLRQSKSKKRFLQMPGRLCKSAHGKNINKIASLVE